MTVTMAMQLIAGVGLFLFGMKLMGEGMEKTAGARLRRVLELLTKNRFIGVLVGILFTVVVQSSSAATVMVVSFVNAGLMNLAQATGVILGANIGTTITAQLVAINLTQFAPIILMVGVVMVQFINKKSVNNLGFVILGFGVLFFGMSVMGTALEPLKNDVQLQAALVSFTNPFLCMLVGLVITAVINSSSAAIGMLQVLALQLDIPLETSVFIVLGSNIGTCVNAILAALAGNKEAKRAALIHLLFNVIGSVSMFILLHVLPLTTWIRSFTHLQAPDGNAALEIANAHTFFKIIEVIIFLPFINQLVKLVQWMVPGKDKQDSVAEMHYLSETVLAGPPAAVHAAVLECERMAVLALDNVLLSVDAFKHLDTELVDQVNHTEDAINKINHGITNYLVRINQLDLSSEDAALIGSLFHIVNDIERIGDHAENIAEFAQRRIDEKLEFSQPSLDELDTMIAAVADLLRDAITLMNTEDETRLPAIRAQEDRIDDLENDYQQAHIDRLTRGECTPAAGMLYADILSNLERVADHATNIAYLMAEKQTLRQKKIAGK